MQLSAVAPCARVVPKKKTLKEEESIQNPWISCYIFQGYLVLLVCFFTVVINHPMFPKHWMFDCRPMVCQGWSGLFEPEMALCGAGE